jgi:tetraacyldisaccharide 4'-kinase
VNRWAAALQRRWYDAERPPPVCLRPLAAAFSSIAAARRARQRAAAEALPVPVIVVGNISVGGTGKTPFVTWLVRELLDLGWKPGIVSRGYGGHAPRYPWPVTADSKAAEVGDEPLLLARRCAVPVVVAPDRRAAALQLLACGTVDVVVADDGLQHYRLPRDLEFCVVDGRRGLGNGALLPAGPLREPPARLTTVDCVVVNGAGWRPEPGVPGVCMHLHLGEAVSLQAPARRQPLSALAGRRVHAFAGIGRPQRFFDALEEQGLRVQPHERPDHHRYTAADFAGLDPAPLLMTEKDAVKCAGLVPADSWMVPVDAVLTAEDAARVRELLARLRRRS